MRQMDDYVSMPDEETLRNLVERIPGERCSSPRCGEAAVAAMRRGDRDMFLCAGHAERAAHRGLSVFRQSADGTGVDEFVVDEAAIRSRWEDRWSADAYAPQWRSQTIPLEILEAVEEEWFPRGATVLDIGCGSGEIAAWLAREGYHVLGVDFAEAAIERAREAHADVPRLAFEVGDIRDRPTRPGEFDALLDRGCLHLVGDEHAPAYVRNVAASAKRGARFLLLHPAYVKAGRDAQVRHLEELLAPEFEIERVADTIFDSDSGASRETPREGLAVWMTRR